jgi:hypothetical protein
MSTLEQDIDILIAETESRKLTWARSNPTVFVSQKPLPSNVKAQLSLQRVMQQLVQLVDGRPRRITTENYVFQLTEIPPGHTRLTINTQQPQYESLREKFKTLFDRISINADREGLDFLRRVIEQ